MSDDLSWLFPVSVRRASEAEERRMREAFTAELKANPDRPPGPAGLARRMGLSNTRNLNGRLSSLRTQLLRDNGFRKDEYRNRWVKR